MRIRLVNLQEWLSRYWRSILVTLFVAFSALLIALTSMVAWSYYNGVVTPIQDETIAKAKEESELNEQWEPIGNSDLEGFIRQKPTFVNSDSSELNFDELENTNSVNSALMHNGNLPLEESDEHPIEGAEYRDFFQNNEDLKQAEIDAKASADKNYFMPPSDNPKPLVKEKPKLDPLPQSSSEKTPVDNQPMSLYKVTKGIKAGAVCLDGSAPAYYHRPGIGPSERSWIIHFNGGAWCFDANACIERSHSSLGSTKKLPKSPPIIQGINSPNPVTNPDFYDWNLVWVVYCDGASFTGNRERPIITKSGQTVYMRGKRVLNAIVNDLLYNRGFQFAESVILTGSSAGSMAAIFQADYIASKFPPNIPVRILADAGFFIDTAQIGGKNLQIAFRKIYDMQNSSSGLNQECVRDLGVDAWKCFIPAITARYIKTPMFVLNSAYDIWALIYFLGIDCKFPATGENIQRKKRTSSIGINYLDDVKQKRDVSGFEIRPFFRDYLSSVHEKMKKFITNIATKNKINKEPSNKTIGMDTRRRTEISNTTVSSNQTKISYVHNITDEISKANSPFIKPSIIVITSNSSAVRNATTNATSPHSVGKSLDTTRIKKTKIEKPAHVEKRVFKKKKELVKTSFMDNLKSIENILPVEMQRINMISDEIANNLHHDGLKADIEKSNKLHDNHLKVDIKLSNKNITKKSNTPSPSKNKKVKKEKIKSTLLDVKTKKSNSTIATDKQKGSKRHVLKQRRSTSIAREYINILRSDPPECTAGEMNKAMLYRDAIVKATDVALSADSGRFLVSCIDHSMSLFDETWLGIKIQGKSIQQAFGDWFFNRVPRDKSNMVDCVYPCNVSCP